MQDYSKKPNATANVYTPQDIAVILKLSRRKAYDLCSHTKDFKVVRIGRNVRVIKDSFDEWFSGLCAVAE